MPRITSLFLLLWFSSSLEAQKFRPYHVFGFEINANVTKLKQKTVSVPGIGDLDPDFDESSLRFDILGSYDFGIAKWLGVSSGVGLSLRGGTGSSYRVGYKEQTFRRDILYLNVPLRLQLKPANFIWFEPGLEFNTYLARSHEVFAYNRSFNDTYEEDFKAVCVNFTAAMRLHLYRGLSLHLGMHSGLSPIYTGPFEYKDSGFRLGVRYMFNQPGGK